MAIDKRDLARVFQERVSLLVERSGGNLSRFADGAGVDRSALTQFLAAGSTRLPRAETLARLAEANGVTLDWLLGLSQDEATIAEVAPALTVEQAEGPADEERFWTWYREALGYKIRYIPWTVPDLLRHETLTGFEFRFGGRSLIEARRSLSQRQLDYSRRPETDIEVCMPWQTIEHIAGGEGIWSELDPAIRSEQIALITSRLEELYPTFRLFLFDGRREFAVPQTIYGPLRAAVFLGRAYLVVSGTEQVRALTVQFDGLIRRADVGPDRAARWVRERWAG